MAVVKLSGSGKSIQFIDDTGTIYSCSVGIMAELMKGEKKTLVTLTRMPFGTDPGKFTPSPVWAPSGEWAERIKREGLEDSLDGKTIKGMKQQKQFEDKRVW